MKPAVSYEAVTREGRPLRTFEQRKMGETWLRERCVAQGARLEVVKTTRQTLVVKS